MDFKRARSEEQIALRRRRILDAALRQYWLCPYDQISLKSISDELEISRASIYNYFPGKADIYLTVASESFSSMVCEMECAFADNAVADNRGLAALWSETLLRNRMVLEMFQRMGTVLKENATQERLSAYHAQADTDFERLRKLVTEYRPQYSADQVEFFLDAQYYYVVGLFPATQAAHGQQTQDDTETPSRPDFVAELTVFLEFLLDGLDRRAGL